MKTKIKLSLLERSVLNAIPKGMEQRKSLTDISYAVGLDKRSLQAIINRLTIYGVPVCSVRFDSHSGVFIPKDDQERNRGLTAIKSQALEMRKRIESVESADLNNWQKKIV